MLAVKQKRLQNIERELRLIRLKLPDRLRLVRDLAILAAANRRLIAEVETYARDILIAVHQHFAGALVVAVGRVAERALREAMVSFDAAIRHPSMGGSAAFRAGMAALARKAV